MIPQTIIRKRWSDIQGTPDYRGIPQILKGSLHYLQQNHTETDSSCLWLEVRQCLACQHKSGQLALDTGKYISCCACLVVSTYAEPSTKRIWQSTLLCQMQWLKTHHSNVSFESQSKYIETKTACITLDNTSKRTKTGIKQTHKMDESETRPYVKESNTI